MAVNQFQQYRGMMVKGPNGNMYNPNELPSNMRMVQPDMTGRAPAAEFEHSGIAPFSRAVFADDYALKPSDQGYETTGLPKFNPNIRQVQQGNMGGGFQTGFGSAQQDFWNFEQDNRGTYGDDKAAFEAYVQANPNLNPSFVNDYRGMLTAPMSQATGSAPQGSPYTTDVLTGPAASTSGPSNTVAYGGALLGGLLGNDLSGALQAAGGYYAGQQGIEGAMATGQAGLDLGESMGKRAYDQSQFRPFGVTSNLANVQTTPEGGVNLNLSPEQQAMQQQLLGQSRGLFGQVGADPAAAQSALYEQIRATQQPEEERQRLQMQEDLFSSGRGGVQTAMYGGTPEQMAYEKARQESMLNANLAARTQSQAEQLQAGQLGGMLQQAGYDPQRQAIDLFGASGVPSQLAAKGQLGGAELQSQAGGRGLESYMQGANMANLLQQQQLQGLMTGAVGKPLTAQEQLMNAMIGKLGGTPIEAGGGLAGSVGNSIGGFFSGLFGGGNDETAQAPLDVYGIGAKYGLTTDQVYAGINPSNSFEENIDFSGSDYDYQEIK